MSNKPVNEKWLWMKGGLLFFLGVIGAALLILQHPDASTMVLLLVIVWSFCRAYHTAFYVTEHYVDPGFKYMGLASFWDYMVDQSSRPKDAERALRYSIDDIARDKYRIKSMMLNWIAIAILGLFFLPTMSNDLINSLRSTWSGRTEVFVLVYMGELGIVSSLFAGLAVFASLASWSIRYRIPVAITLVVIFSSSLFLGLQEQSAPTVLGSFMLPVVVFLFTCAMCSLTRWFLGWRLVPRSALAMASDKVRGDSNWGIAYLFLLSALVAFCVSLLTSVVPPSAIVNMRSGFQSDELLFLIVQLIDIAMVSTCAVFLFLASRLTLPGKWVAVCYLLVVALGPFALPLMFNLISGNPATLFSNVRASYSFQIGLVTGLAVLFSSARFAQVRLLDRPLQA